jgi:phenylpropionate dioxygenase-like ring-hydroxylating dioxygenase large terminal subunit
MMGGGPTAGDATTANELDVAGEARLYRAMRRFWHPVAYGSELTDRPVGVVLLEEALVLVRLGGQVRCFADLCAHRGTALSLGRVEDDELRCAYHGWTYGADGVCTRIPARFGSNIPRRARLRPYRVQEAYGLIWVCLDGDPVYPIPEFPEWGDERYRIVPIPAYDWRCNAARRLENFVDFAHFAWVHDGVLGDRAHPEVADHEVRRVGGELRFDYDEMVEPASADKNRAVGEGVETLPTAKRYRVSVPNTVLLEETIGPGATYVLFFTVCPVGPKVVRNFTFMARDYMLEDPEEGDRTMLEFNELVIQQDHPIVESQRPEQLPFDLSAELHVRGVDRVSLEYRRWLVELANELTPTARVG